VITPLHGSNWICDSDADARAIEARSADDHSVSTVKAVFAMALALVQAIEPDSLKRMNRPVRIIAGDGDTVAPPETNAQVAAKEIPGAQLQMLQAVGHYAFLATCPPFAAANVPVCAQAGPQEESHRLAIEQAKALFKRTL
jgi:predicted dienelactone hydrolase